MTDKHCLADITSCIVEENLGCNNTYQLKRALVRTADEIGFFGLSTSGQVNLELFELGMVSIQTQGGKEGFMIRLSNAYCLVCYHVVDSVIDGPSHGQEIELLVYAGEEQEETEEWCKFKVECSLSPLDIVILKAEENDLNRLQWVHNEVPWLSPIPASRQRINDYCYGFQSNVCIRKGHSGSLIFGTDLVYARWKANYHCGIALHLPRLLQLTRVLITAVEFLQQHVDQHYDDCGMISRLYQDFWSISTEIAEKCFLSNDFDLVNNQYVSTFNFVRKLWPTNCTRIAEIYSILKATILIVAKRMFLDSKFEPMDKIEFHQFRVNSDEISTVNSKQLHCSKLYNLMHGATGHSGCLKDTDQDFDFHIIHNVLDKLKLKNLSEVDTAWPKLTKHRGVLRGCVLYMGAVLCGNHISETKCWDMRGMVATAYDDITWLVEYLEDHKTKFCNGTTDEKLQFVHSDIPLKFKNVTNTDVPTGCHHPALCENSRCKGKNPSHCCSKPSHLVLAPGAMNKKHLSFQRTLRKNGVQITSSITERIRLKPSTVL